MFIKCAWFIQLDVHTGATIMWNDESFHAKVMVMPVFISGRPNQARFKKNTFILILKRFKNRCNLLPKMIITKLKLSIYK